MPTPETYRLCACGCGNRVFKPYNTSIWPKYYMGHAPKPEKKNLSVKKESVKPIRKPSQKIKVGKSNTKSLNKTLDNIWSELVKINAGYKCEYCGLTKNLNSHHIYSRGKMSVRWNLKNGICLCVGHHIGLKFSAHKTPAEFIDWIRKYRGLESMEKLMVSSNYTTHYSDFEKEILLKELNIIYGKTKHI